MNISALILALLVVLFFESVANAQSPSSIPAGFDSMPVLSIHAEGYEDTVKMSALVKEGNLAGLMGAAPDLPAETFWLKDIERKNGVVLFSKKGLDVLKLQGQLNRETQEGQLELAYLTNALKGKYKKCSLEVKKKGEGWTLQNAYTKKPLTDVTLKMGTLGINTIQGLCK